LSNPRAGTDQY